MKNSVIADEMMVKVCDAAEILFQLRKGLDGKQRLLLEDAYAKLEDVYLQYFDDKVA